MTRKEERVQQYLYTGKHINIMINCATLMKDRDKTDNAQVAALIKGINDQFVVTNPSLEYIAAAVRRN